MTVQRCWLTAFGLYCYRWVSPAWLCIAAIGSGSFARLPALRSRVPYPRYLTITQVTSLGRVQSQRAEVSSLRLARKVLTETAYPSSPRSYDTAHSEIGREVATSVGQAKMAYRAFTECAIGTLRNSHFSPKVQISGRNDTSSPRSHNRARISC